MSLESAGVESTSTPDESRTRRPVSPGRVHTALEAT
jgi:hypothetical protein